MLFKDTFRTVDRHIGYCRIEAVTFLLAGKSL